MTHLSLFLLTGSGPQLERVEYTSPGGVTSISTRGKTSLGGGSSFPFTAGVQALALLLVKTKLEALKGNTSEAFFIEGEGGSLAAALDSSLTKSPVWLSDMFGVDDDGHALSRRLFPRENPERKRFGPVRIGLDASLVPPESITISLDKTELLSEQSLEALHAALLSGRAPRLTSRTIAAPHQNFLAQRLPPAEIPFPRLRERLEHLRSLGPLPKPFCHEKWLPHVLENLTSDIIQSLRQMDIFSAPGQSRFIKQVNENSLFRKLTKKPFAPFHTVHNQPDFLRLGVAPDPQSLVRDLTSENTINVYHPTGPYAAPVIFDYLTYVKGYNFCTHGQYYCGTHLVADLLEARIDPIPDALILGMDAAGFLLSSQSNDDYIPFMLFPLSPHVILTPSRHNTDVESSGDYILQKDPFDCCKAYFRSAADSSFVNRRKVSTHALSPDIAFQLLREGKEKLRLPTGLEYYRLIEPFHECSLTKEPFLLVEGSEVVLVVHRRLLAGTRALHLELAIRDAWLTLMEEPATVRSLLEQQLLNHNFLTSIKRFAGLYGISTIYGDELKEAG